MDTEPKGNVYFLNMPTTEDQSLGRTFAYYLDFTKVEI